MAVILKKIGMRGDTIVEVLIVLAILGLAIGISYKTANLALLDTGDAEQNSQASNYVSGEVEDLRYLAPSSDSADTSQDPTSNIFSPSGAFCITNPTAASPIIIATSSSCNFGPVPYHVLIYNCDNYHSDSTDVCTGIPASSDTFVVQATWPGVTGDGTDSTTMTYRVHSPDAITDEAGPDAGPSGSAAVGSQPGSACTIATCGPPQYIWEAFLENNSPADEAGEITGCTWNFGDGSSSNNVACQPGDPIDHTYTPPPGWPATYNAALCYTVPFTVTLTLNLNNGLNPTTTFNFDLPQCWS